MYGFDVLPDEVLELVGSYLDGFSFVSLALCTRRLQNVLLNSKETRRRRFNPSRQYLDPLTLKVAAVRQLDLSNCFADPSTIRALLAECPHLKELNIVNSSVTRSRPFVDIICQLSKLESLSYSLTNVPTDLDDENFVDEQLVGRHPNLRRIYVECIASVRALMIITKIVSGCKRVEYVHLNFIGEDVCDDEFVLFRLPNIHKTWRSVHTIVGSFHMSHKGQRFRNMNNFVLFCDLLRMTTYARRDMLIYRTIWFEDNEITEIMATKNIARLPKRLRLYDVDKQIIESPTDHKLYRWPTYVVELDLTSLTSLRFSETSWNDLVENSPLIEALSVPVCFLPKGDSFESWPTHDDDDDDNNDDSQLVVQPHGRGTATSSYAIRALGRLKLRKLHISGSQERSCNGCKSIAKRYVIGELARLPYLEEFTLTCVPPSPDLLVNAANARVKVMRLCLDDTPRLDGLHAMLEKSPNLSCFKLEAQNLPLHSALLWEALADCSSLKQLCLASGSDDAVDLAMIGRQLSNVLNGLDVVHLHAPRQDDLYRTIQKCVEKINLTRLPNRTIQLLEQQCMSLSEIEKMTDITPVPGRNLCCTSTHIAKIPTHGWYAADQF